MSFLLWWRKTVSTDEDLGKIFISYQLTKRHGLQRRYTDFNLLRIFPRNLENHMSLTSCNKFILGAAP
ncbi:hypothetical protein Y1Q_0009694 [Alligator mississippiensis]|uniref:Uncharacterized protein n=1 Tax=Alligator mississippiensis TaxID=8496 RepID=A0A151MWB6_ALLMI|nr:hypothetical protein Y1Q_0009694 [Alligator mississippiensis]